MNKIPVKISKEVSDFIERIGTATVDEYNDEHSWYWIPYYFKKVGEGLFETYIFKDLPSGLKHIVERSEPTKPEEDE